MAVIGKVKHAQQVVDSGIDMIVAQGHDGGGHNSPIGTFSLIPQVVDAVGDRVPVIGAGGISDGRGVAAAMMLGALGAWVGTAFLATEEAGIERFQKEAITDRSEEHTSELQSLMRTSYAVFCLTKQNHIYQPYLYFKEYMKS